MPELSDEKIMLLVKEGHLSELTELFDRYHVPLYNFFLRLTMDRATSEDLTQSLFYRIIRYRQSYQPGQGTFRSWVYRMARNIHADFCKQQKQAPQRPIDPDEADLSLADHSAGYAEADYQRLDEALALLPSEQREILVLSRYQGLKYEEISKIKDISVSAIKVQVYRAIRQLRSLYFKQS
ncbi:MAG: RNA polymerase sigma factor [Bacteroidetes bacterium]|nr:RNA polymerase sigma factor [Bacteroidota bacterium]